MNKFFKLSAAVLFVGTSLAISGADLTFRDAEIVIAKKATFAAETGARDLQYHLRKMTGAKFPVGVKPGPGVNFYLGFGDAKGFESDEFVIDARGNRIDIYGYDTAKPVDLFNYYAHKIKDSSNEQRRA